MMSNSSQQQVVIIGAGMSGICMAIKLLEVGIDNFLLLEKNDGIGGTWYDNTYPGASCDVPSHLYSYSFELNPEWSRIYAPQTEIKTYFEDCVDKYGIRSHIRFNAELSSADFDEERGEWKLNLADGSTICSKALISGVGQLSRPYTPDFPGLGSFQGQQFHSARWDHNYSLAGKRVAVIGTAASAIQFIPPVAEEAAKVHVFQRSPNYILPRYDRAYYKFERNLLRRFRFLCKLNRYVFYALLESAFPVLLSGSRMQRFVSNIAKGFIKRQVKDPMLREKLTPDYPIGAKRILRSDDYYQALQRDNVELICDPIKQFDAGSIVDESGRNYDIDVVIFGTGFKATEFLVPMTITGQSGQRLNEVWQGGAEALYGVALPNFPNFFMLYGPNTNLAHNSIIFMVEAQVKYIKQCLQKLFAGNHKYMEAKEEEMHAYNQDIQDGLKKTAWSTDCINWYKNTDGKITNNWPYSSYKYWKQMSELGFEGFSFIDNN